MNTKIVTTLFFCLITILLNGQITIDYPTTITIECGTDLVPSENNEILDYPNVSTLCNSGGLDVSYTDNTDGLTECSGTGILLRFWTAKDNCGGLMTLLQKITIEDTTPPEITCLPDKSIECDASLNPGDNPELGMPTAHDCSEEQVTLTYSDEEIGTGICNNAPELVLRTWTATDGCGNTATCQQTIRVGIETLIVFCEPQDLVQECNGLDGSRFAAESWDLSHINQLTNCTTSECGGIEVISDFDFGRMSDDCGITGSFEVNYLIKDACGNSKFKSATFTLRDTTPPQSFCDPLNFEISCEGDETASSRVAGWHRDNLSFLQNCLFDNCGDVTISSDFDTTTFDINNLNFDCTDTVGFVVNYILSDECGNTTTKKAALKIVDFVPPYFENVARDTSVGAGQTAPVTTPTVLDNCSSNLSATFSENRIDNSNDEGYTLVRTWTATDACGNTGEVSQRVMVLDPILSLACTSTEVQVSGNQIIISNLQAPNEIVKVFNSNNAIVYNCFRNCGEVQTTRALPEGTYKVDVEYYTATWQFICDAIISVTIGVVNECDAPDCEATAPIFSNVPADVTVACTAVPAPAAPTATDNCDDNVTISLEENGAGDCTSDYSITRTWTATDDCGNTASAQQIITVKAENNAGCGTNPCETTPPVLSNIPENMTVTCNAIPTIPNNISASDNCDTNVEILFEESQTASDCANGYTITRTWTAIDDCGNSSVGEQVIQVMDESTPPLSNVCDAIQISTNGNIFNFSNLNAPNKIVKVFDENYHIVLQCNENCGTDLSLSYDIPGTYFADVQLYTADWVFICETRKSVILEENNNNNGACADVQITSAQNGIAISNLNVENKIVKVFSEDYQLLFECFANCDEEVVVPISGLGTYHTDIQFYSDDWQFMCEDRQDISISASSPADICELIECIADSTTNSNPVCSDIEISTTSNQISIAGLNAPNEIVKVFNEDYDLLYECFGNCAQTTAVANLVQGKYQININFYDENWTPICELIETVSLTSNLLNPNLSEQTFSTSTTSNQVALFPNPATDEVMLTLKPFVGKQVHLSIYNQFGQQLWQKSIKKVTGQIEIISLAQFDGGIHLLHIQPEKGEAMVKKLLIHKINR